MSTRTTRTAGRRIGARPIRALVLLLPMARHTIQISGPPLRRPIILRRVRRDRTIHRTGWLLSAHQAAYLLGFWATSPTGDSDVVREWRYSSRGYFTIGLYLEGGLALALWESSVGKNGVDLYSTTTLPLGFEVKQVRR